MKKSLILLFLFSISNHIFSQSKQDYYWPFGLGNQENLMPFAFDFNKRPYEPIVRSSDIWFDQMNASICDQDGNLLLYTNGCAVANRNHQMMPNGDSINAGRWFDEFWGGDCSRGYATSQDITIIEDPGNNNGFYIFHKPTSYNPDSVHRFSKDSLQFTYVDLTLDNGFGDITNKNETFFRGSLVANYLTPILHLNQKDYWIINPIFPSGFLTFLLDENGIHNQGIHPGPVWDPRKASSSGYARFSPDGTKYAYFNQFDGLYLYDFDRSDANFSNEQHIPGTRPEIGIFAACEWSPNSRFLYMSRADSLWQLDTEAQPLISGRELISVKTDPTVPNYLVAALGPDCRIYIRDKGSKNTMNVIHKPNEKGLACDFEEEGVLLPFTSSAGSFPNFPRFRVDEEEKCDPSITSLFGETVWYRRDLTTYPNPVSDRLTIELPEEVGSGYLYVVDLEGKLVWEGETESIQSVQQLDMSGYAEGTYSVEFVPEDNKERRVWTSRVVKVE